MKIIAFKESSRNFAETTYLNADRIATFCCRENMYSGAKETVIAYDMSSYAHITGDRVHEIKHFLPPEENSGILDLTKGEDQKKSFWEEKK